MKRFSIILFLFIGLVACGKQAHLVEGVDMEAWRLDKNGCTGFRHKTNDSFQDQADKLLGLTEMDIVELLGNPDQHELYKRNQKFYIYFLQPSTGCPKPIENPLKLVIRFNAIGLAKEISTE